MSHHDLSERRHLAPRLADSPHAPAGRRGAASQAPRAPYAGHSLAAIHVSAPPSPSEGVAQLVKRYDHKRHLFVNTDDDEPAPPGYMTVSPYFVTSWAEWSEDPPPSAPSSAIYAPPPGMDTRGAPSSMQWPSSSPSYQPPSMPGTSQSPPLFGRPAPPQPAPFRPFSFQPQLPSASNSNSAPAPPGPSRYYFGSGDLSKPLKFVRDERRQGRDTRVKVSTYDSSSDANRKYPEQYGGNAIELSDYRVPVVDSVDATNPETTSDTEYDEVHFEFPHTGVYGGGSMERDRQSVESNERLMEGTFRSAKKKVRTGGRLRISEGGFPYRDNVRARGMDLDAIARSHGYVPEMPERLPPEEVARTVGEYVPLPNPVRHNYRLDESPVQRRVSAWFPHVQERTLNGLRRQLVRQIGGAGPGVVDREMTRHEAEIAEMRARYDARARMLRPGDAEGAEALLMAFYEEAGQYAEHQDFYSG